MAPGLRADYAQFTDPSYTAEANALLAGMAARAAALGDASLLHVPELRRNFSYVDLFSINACGEIAVDLASRRGGLMTAGTLFYRYQWHFDSGAGAKGRGSLKAGRHPAFDGWAKTIGCT